MEKKKYIGTYKVFKLYRKSQRREILARNLSLEEAQNMCQSFPDSNTSMVCFEKQFTAKKYFVDVDK